MFTASVGGIFGLCLGGSVISILEFLYVFGKMFTKPYVKVHSDMDNYGLYINEVAVLKKNKDVQKELTLKQNVVTISIKKSINNGLTTLSNL